MPKNQAPEIYDFLIYLLSGLSALLLTVMGWIFSGTKKKINENLIKMNELTDKCFSLSERIGILEKDIENLRHELGQ